MDGNNGLTRFIYCWLIACMTLPVNAQQTADWIDHAEEALNREDDSGLSEELCEARQELLFYPVNLNRATREQLESCGLFTAYQVYSIIRYREKYGDLLSIYELAVLDGFRRAQLEKQAIYINVSNNTRINRGRAAGTTILLFAGKTSTNPEQQPVYPGSPWKTSLRLKTGLGRRGSAGVAYEKDPGEKILWGYRPEHLSGFVELKGGQILEKLLFGTYRLNNGMGLIQGAGLMHIPGEIQSGPLILCSLKPYAGAGESMIHQGAACKLNLGLLKVVLWSSLQKIDLSLGKLTSLSGKPDWSGYIRATGYHRTPTEQSGRNLAYLGSAGIQVVVSMRKLTLGAQYAPEINGLSGRGKDSLQYFAGPNLYHSSSIQWKWRVSKLEFYGEFAPGGNSSSALLGGSRFFINDFLSGAVQVHWYGAAHRETFASAYASGSHLMNEKGLLILIHAEPFRRVRSDLAVELFEYPAPRTHSGVPSSGFRYNFTLQNGIHEQLRWRFRMVKTSRQQTPSVDLPGIRPLATIQNNRIDGRVIYKPFDKFAWQSRLVISYSPEEPASQGYAALQQVTIMPNKRLRCTAQLVIYHVPSWNNRIYLHEPGLYHQFRFPVYSGTGEKISLVISMKPVRRVTLEGKGSLIFTDEINRSEAGIQLRLNF